MRRRKCWSSPASCPGWCGRHGRVTACSASMLNDVAECICTLGDPPPTRQAEEKLYDSDVVSQAPSNAELPAENHVSWTWDLDKWRADGVPMEIVSAVAACTNGVKRAHLVRACAQPPGAKS